MKRCSICGKSIEKGERYFNGPFNRGPAKHKKCSNDLRVEKGDVMIGGFGHIGSRTLTKEEYEQRGIIAKLERENTKLRTALKELRRWVGDGDCSDDVGIWPGYATTAYKDAVAMADKALADGNVCDHRHSAGGATDAREERL